MVELSFFVRTKNKEKLSKEYKKELFAKLLWVFSLLVPCFIISCNGSDSPSIESEVVNHDADTAAVLTIFQLIPDSGDLNGGDEVIILGQGFKSGIEVFFGDDSAEVKVFEESRLRVITPPHKTGEYVDIFLKNPDGSSFLLKDGFRYVDKSVFKIENCYLTVSDEFTINKGETSEKISGKVLVSGNFQNAKAKIKAELGMGAIYKDPSLFEDEWSFEEMEKTDEEESEQKLILIYTGALKGEKTGDFSYAIRVTDGSNNWIYCDSDGSGNGFSVKNAGVIHVTEKDESR